MLPSSRAYIMARALLWSGTKGGGHVEDGITAEATRR